MKPLPFLAVVFGVLFALSPCLAQKPGDEIPKLKADADKARAEAEASSAKDCTKDCLEAARKLVELSDAYFTAGNAKDGHAAMHDAGDYALRAGKAVIETKKRRKDTEIGLRKLQKRIHDIEETLNFEDRPPVNQILAGINKSRSDILMSMFDMPKKELGPEPKENP